MKTLIKIILVLLTISFISCDNKNAEERQNERLHSKLSVINYNGHDYIIYTDARIFWNGRHLSF